MQEIFVNLNQEKANLWRDYDIKYFKDSKQMDGIKDFDNMHSDKDKACVT